MRRLVLEFDRLVLDDVGLTPAQAQRLRAGVELELQRLLSQEPGLINLQGGEVASVSVPGPELTTDGGEGLLARRLARSLAAALRGLE